MFSEKAKELTNGKVIGFHPTKAKIADILDAVAAETQLPMGVSAPAWLDKGRPHPAAQIISCENGLLHLATRSLSSNTPHFFGLNALDYAYEANAPEPEVWLNFLKTLWPNDCETIATLQEFFGYCLTSDTRFQKALLIIGPKRSGKGTIMRALTQLVGVENVCSPTFSSLGRNFGLAPLIGKRLALISDARLGGKTDLQSVMELFLAVTGEDTMSVDRKYQEHWTGKLPTKFAVASNETPRFTDASGALPSRFIISRMVNSFYGSEDLTLGDRLSLERPGILNWAIAGLERLLSRGHFVQPSSSRELLQELEDLASPINAFVRDCCNVGPGHRVSVDEIYTTGWCAWCVEQGRDHHGTKQVFGRDLRAALPGLTTTQPREGGTRSRCYEGISLKPTGEEQPYPDKPAKLRELEQLLGLHNVSAKL